MRAGAPGPLALVLGLSAALAGAASADDPPAPPAPPAPRLGELNAYVLRAIDGYPTDGTHPYNWPKDDKSESYGGVTEDVVYQGEVIAKANGKGECYCCGLTFEVFVKAWKAWAEKKRHGFAIGDLDAAALKRVRSAWYCAGSGDDARAGPVAALVPRGLGVRIERLEEARPGDFVQLWRTNGSGHSVIFLAWVTDRAGAIVGIDYWSTQPGTNGIGRRVERFDGPKAVKRDELFIARAGVPR